MRITVYYPIKTSAFNKNNLLHELIITVYMSQDYLLNSQHLHQRLKQRQILAAVRVIKMIAFVAHIPVG